MDSTHTQVTSKTHRPLACRILTDWQCSINFQSLTHFYSGSVCQQQAMAASLLEDNLRSLNECLTNADNSSKEQADSIVADISQICINESTDKDIGT